MPGSEYIGLRLSMLDALQQYYKTPGLLLLTPLGRQELLEKKIEEAAGRNNLLGDRKEIIGKAWTRLIASKSPEAIDKFVNDPDIKKMATSMTETDKNGKVIEIKDKVSDMGLTGATTYMLLNAATLSPMVTKFETIAQKTGLINYKGLDDKGVEHKDRQESLSGQIDYYCKEIENEMARKAPAPTPPPEEKGFSGLIDKIFNNDFSGRINRKWFHQDEAAPAVTPKPPQTPSPGDIKNIPAPAGETKGR